MHTFFSICALLAFAASGVAQQGPPPPDQEFKAVHLFKLASAEDEKLIIAGLAPMNRAVASAGHPEIRYRVWKISGDASGAYTHMLESTWPSRAVYVKVHTAPEYRAAFEKYVKTTENLMQGHVYNRYVEVK